MRAGRERRGFTLLAVVLLGVGGFALFERFYLVRELLLFAVFAALLVFFAANLAAVGILAHAVGRSIVGLLRKTRSTAALHEEIPAERHDGSFAGSPTMRTAARVDSNLFRG